MHTQAIALLSSFLSVTGFIGGGAVLAFNDDARAWLLGDDWLDDYPSFTIHENPCPGFEAQRSVVPEVLVVRVLSGDGSSVPDAVVTTMQEAVDQELTRLDVRVVAGHSAVPTHGASIQTLYVHVVTDGTLQTWDDKKINGFYCKGHIVQSAFQDHPEFTQAVFLHEFGHYLGLCHEDGTWMRLSMGASGVPEEAQRWSAQQTHTIDRWSRDGAVAPAVCLHH